MTKADSSLPTEARKGTPGVQVVALTVFPFVVVLVEIIIKTAADAPILPGLGPTLATVALGQVMPFVVFESLLATKVLSLSGSYKFEGAELSVRYLVAPQRDSRSIERLRTMALLLFIGCLLVWMGSIALATRVSPDQGYSIWATLLGALNCLLAWLFLVKG